jgi:MFS family permease
MIVGSIQMGFVIWAFYAWQPYLLDLLGRDAIWVAGLISAAVALATIAGNQVVDAVSRYCGRRTTLLLGAAGIQSAAAILLGLTSSFWIALAALLAIMGALGVEGPVRQAYLQYVIPSERRATVTSFDSMVSGVGGVGGQLGLGALGEARSVPAAFVAGGVAVAGAIPVLAAVRRIGGSADAIVGRKAGVEGSCAAAGLPTVSTVEAQPVGEPDAAVAVRAS